VLRSVRSDMFIEPSRKLENQSSFRSEMFALIALLKELISFIISNESINIQPLRGWEFLNPLQ